MRRSFCLISLATNMLESWDIIHWKGGIHSFVWSTKNFLYQIWEPRYKQIKMGYQILENLYIGQSLCLEIWCPTLIYLYFCSLILYRNGFELETFLKMSTLKWDLSQPLRIFIAKEIIQNRGGIRFQDIRLSITSNMIPQIVLLISRLPDIITQESFCTPDRAMGTTF